MGGRLSIRGNDARGSGVDPALHRLPKRKLPLAHPKTTTKRPFLDKSQVGYSDGITAGKGDALQEGFDAGFAQTGAPLGHELGLLRGLANALLLHVSRTSSSSSDTSANVRVREIVDALAAVRLADLAPPPLHEEADGGHTHCGAEDVNSGKQRHDAERDEGEETSLRRSDGLVGSSTAVTTIEDVRALRVKLETLLRESGLKVDLDLEVF